MVAPTRLNFVTSDAGEEIRKAQSQATQNVAGELAQRQKMQKMISSEKAEQRAAGQERTLANYAAANPDQSAVAFQRGAGQELAKAGHGAAGAQLIQRGASDQERVMRHMFDALEKNQPQLAQNFAQSIGYQIDGDMVHNARVGQAYGVLLDVVQEYSADPAQKQQVASLVKTIVDRGIRENTSITRDSIITELHSRGIIPRASTGKQPSEYERHKMAMGLYTSDKGSLRGEKFDRPGYDTYMAQQGVPQQQKIPQIQTNQQTTMPDQQSSGRIIVNRATGERMQEVNGQWVRIDPAPVDQPIYGP